LPHAGFNKTFVDEALYKMSNVTKIVVITYSFSSAANIYLGTNKEPYLNLMIDSRMNKITKNVKFEGEISVKPVTVTHDKPIVCSIKGLEFTFYPTILSQASLGGGAWIYLVEFNN